MENYEEVIESTGEITTNYQVVTGKNALSDITTAELDVSISTAKQYPRSIKIFLEKAKSLATVSEDVAASCSYAVPRDGKTIIGPSIRLAEIVCAAYGNTRSGARIISNDGKSITAQGICHDLENNNCVTVEVKVGILKKDGRQYSETMQITTGNAACSKALRNAVYKVIPLAIIHEIWEETKRVAKGTADTLPARRKKAVDYLVSKGITEKQICDILEIKRIEDIDLDKITTLRGMATAVQNGEATLEELFNPGQDHEAAKQAATDIAAKLVKKGEVA